MFPLQEEAKISKWEQVEIPDEYKGRVIGKGGAKLVEISAQTGVSLTRKGGEVYIIRGTEQQRQHARVNIGDIVVCICLFFALCIYSHSTKLAYCGLQSLYLYNP